MISQKSGAMFEHAQREKLIKNFEFHTKHVLVKLRYKKVTKKFS